LKKKQKRERKLLKKMSSLTTHANITKVEQQKKFEKMMDELRKLPEFEPGSATLADYMKNGHGDLDEGIRTTMRLGDLNILGRPEDAPEETVVAEDYAHFYEGQEMAPLVKLMTTLTVTGDVDTKPGDWKLLYESDKSRLRAFVWMLRNMQTQLLLGQESGQERFDKILKELVEKMPVIIVKMKGSDELWAEWSRSQDVGHADLQHSVERNSVKFMFFSKLKISLKNEMVEQNGSCGEILHKELFQAYVAAEKERKFKNAKGMAGIKREQELSQLMKWGETITKFELMPEWRQLEVVTEGKTAFFQSHFANSFLTMVENDESIAKYVMNSMAHALTLQEAKVGISWRKKVVEATVPKMKTIVKTMVLEWNWTCNLFGICKRQEIMPAEKMKKDFDTIGVVFNFPEAVQFQKDSTGKKANLHPLTLEIFETSYKVLVEQTHYATFQAADAMGKNFQNTIMLDALTDLCMPNIVNPWKDTAAAYEGKFKVSNGEEEIPPADQEEDMVWATLPTRDEAIIAVSKNEVELYLGTSFVKTGDVARDREKLAQCLY